MISRIDEDTAASSMAAKMTWNGRVSKEPAARIRVESGAVYVVPFSFLRSYLSHEIVDESCYRAGRRPIVLFPRVEAGEASREWFEALLDDMEELHRCHLRERLETPGVSPLGGGVDVGLIDIPVTFRAPPGPVAAHLEHRPTEIFEANLEHVDALFAGTFHDRMTLVSVLHVFRPGGARQVHCHNLVFGVRREFRDGRVLVGPLDFRPMLDALASALPLGVVGLG